MRETLLYYDLFAITYFLSPFMKFSIMLVNSIGKMYLVEAPWPRALRVSKYCKVIVFWSTNWADAKIWSSALA